jgi:predicted dinucleotide-binding enzyme
MARTGIIGSGNIGRTLGEAWRRAGHEVAFASRSPDPPSTVAIAEAIAGAEVVLLAVPGAAVPQLLAEHGPALDGRVVIDATNDMGGERLLTPTPTASRRRARGWSARSTRSGSRCSPTRPSAAPWPTCSGAVPRAPAWRR